MDTQISQPIHHSQAQLINGETNRQIQLNFLQWLIVILTFYFAMIVIQYIVFVLWNIIKLYWPGSNLLKTYTQNDQEAWAVVTGATDGIGLGFCQQFVQRGFNVCLISRNQQKLSKVIEKLQQQRPQQFKSKKIQSIQFDFTNIKNHQKFQKLICQIQKLKIAVFVNNVGISYTGDYEKASYQNVVNIINVNCLAMASLNAKLVKSMNCKKGRSAIINLSSVAGHFATPYSTLYTSTKVFDRFMSEGLAIQYPKIDILSLTPFLVQTKSLGVKQNYNVPSARKYANHCLKQLQFRQSSSFGYFGHQLIGTFLLNLPKWIVRKITKIKMKQLLVIRAQNKNKSQ